MDLSTIYIAVSSFVQINQVNAKSVANDRKKLNARLMSVMGREEIPNMQLLDCVLVETATELLSLTVDNVEDRRVRWTTYRNLNAWFINWEHNLELLGFADWNANKDKLVIPQNQLGCIINVDKTCVLMDERKGRRGGRPSVIFFSPMLPKSGRPTGQSGLATTLLTCSTLLQGKRFRPTFSSPLGQRLMAEISSTPRL